MVLPYLRLLRLASSMFSVCRALEDTGWQHLSDSEINLERYDLIRRT